MSCLSLFHHFKCLGYALLFPPVIVFQVHLLPLSCHCCLVHESLLKPCFVVYLGFVHFVSMGSFIVHWSMLRPKFIYALYHPYTSIGLVLAHPQFIHVFWFMLMVHSRFVMDHSLMFHSWIFALILFKLQVLMPFTFKIILHTTWFISYHVLTNSIQGHYKLCSRHAHYSYQPIQVNSISF